IWTKYEKEIDKWMETYPPQARIMPQNWLMALTMVKGQHDQEIAKAELDKTDFFSEGASHGSAASREMNANAGDNEKLTPEEIAMCESMHWDQAGYLKRKKEMAVHQSSKGAYARFSVPDSVGSQQRS